MSPHDVKREIFKRWVAGQGGNLKALATDAGVPYTTLHSYYRGQTKTLRSDYAEAIAHSRGLTVEQLFGGQSDSAPTKPTADLPNDDPEIDHVQIEVLPTFGGMGGGGTGEGAPEYALIARRLVEGQIGARPADLLLINVRGNSMEPLFLHGDQLLIDRRDRNPVQPGPFALYYEEGYVVKNVERIPRSTKFRISSLNASYSPDEAEAEEVQIMGRPVWFARRL